MTNITSVSLAALTLMLSSSVLASSNVPDPHQGQASTAPGTGRTAAHPMQQAPSNLSVDSMVDGTVVAERLRARIEGNLSADITREQDREGVAEFYKDRDFVPLWIEHDAVLPRTNEAIRFLRSVASEGLDPADYPIPDFSGTDPDKLAAAELGLTNSILTFVRHASTGRVAFSRASESVFVDQTFPNAEDVLRGLAAATDVGQALDSYNPQHAAYKALKAELAAERHRKQTATRSIQIPNGPLLRPGETDVRTPLLRRRLNLPTSDARRYDEVLIEAVRAFQRDHGLNPDGIVGPETLAKLNGQSQHGNTERIIVNMERWRWMPRDLGAAYVVVNVPDFSLSVVKDGATLWSTRIVVGKPGRYATPLMTETMKSITVNPTWNVPPSIIRKDYLPALQRDPGALARIGLRVSRNNDGSLRVYQPPGERNALGRLRFNFPNLFLVYQHDTPDKHLFKQATRAYSHGCMRVEYPAKYAEVLLSLSQPEDKYTAERIQSIYGKGERAIKLNNPIPVYITYQTAFRDSSGIFQTRSDIYGLDGKMTKLLNEDRRVADIPVARNYHSSSKPVMAQIPMRRGSNTASTMDYGFAQSGRHAMGDTRRFQFGNDWDDRGGPRRPYDRHRIW